MNVKSGFKDCSVNKNWNLEIIEIKLVSWMLPKKKRVAGIEETMKQNKTRSRLADQRRITGKKKQTKINYTISKCQLKSFFMFLL